MIARHIVYAHLQPYLQNIPSDICFCAIDYALKNRYDFQEESHVQCTMAKALPIIEKQLDEKSHDIIAKCATHALQVKNTTTLSPQWNKARSRQTNKVIKEALKAQDPFIPRDKREKSILRKSRIFQKK